MRLYELADAYRTIQTAATEDWDDAAFTQALEDIQDAIGDKAENIAKLIRGLEADAEVIDSEVKRLTARRDARRNRAEDLKAYLKANLEAVGMTSVKGQLFTVTIQNSPPRCNITDLDAIHWSYRVVIPETWRPDAKAIIEAIKRGEYVLGAEVIIGTHLRIR